MFLLSTFCLERTWNQDGVFVFPQRRRRARVHCKTCKKKGRGNYALFLCPARNGPIALHDSRLRWSVWTFCRPTEVRHVEGFFVSPILFKVSFHWLQKIAQQKRKKNSTRQSFNHVPLRIKLNIVGVNTTCIMLYLTRNSEDACVIVAKQNAKRVGW